MPRIPAERPKLRVLPILSMKGAPIPTRDGPKFPRVDSPLIRHVLFQEALRFALLLDSTWVPSGSLSGNMGRRASGTGKTGSPTAHAIREKPSHETGIPWPGASYPRCLQAPSPSQDSGRSDDLGSPNDFLRVTSGRPTEGTGAAPATRPQSPGRGHRAPDACGHHRPVKIPVGAATCGRRTLFCGRPQVAPPKARGRLQARDRNPPGRGHRAPDACGHHRPVKIPVGAATCGRRTLFCGRPQVAPPKARGRLQARDRNPPGRGHRAPDACGHHRPVKIPVGATTWDRLPCFREKEPVGGQTYLSLGTPVSSVERLRSIESDIAVYPGVSSFFIFLKVPNHPGMLG